MKRVKGQKEDQHSFLSNLWYWFRKIYRQSPMLAWLFVMEVPVAIAISLMGAYLPSRLVADITELSQNGQMKAVLVNLTLNGAVLTILYVSQCWLQNAQAKKRWKVSFSLSKSMAEASMTTCYANVENSKYQKMFYNITDNIIWSPQYTLDFFKEVIETLSALLGMILYISMLSGVSYWILLLIVVGVAVNLGASVLSNRIGKRYEKQCWKHDLELSYLTRHASAHGVAKDVHLYHMAPWFTRLYDQGLKARMHLTVKQQMSYYLDSLARHTATFIWQLPAYVSMIYSVCEGKISAAEFVFYIGILTEFSNWCRKVVMSIKELHNTSLGIEQERELGDILQKGCQEGEEELKITPGHVPEIIFKNVTFQYEGADEPTIRDMNLILHPGENLAVVGQNGAGKTTFIKLLCGFYDPTEGEILIDGVDRTRYTRQSWMRAISGVFQDMGFFPMSLIDNLVPENPQEANVEKLWNCLEMANLKERVQKLPEGLKTMFGLGIYEDAVEFSGGEKQRLMLARSLYKEAPLLLLDEPTSALDPLMESELYEQYCKFSQGKTTVFISHRLASTRFCDRILLMEQGKIVEEGSHEELLNKQGSYAKMYQVQSKYYQDKQEFEAAFEGTFAVGSDER